MSNDAPVSRCSSGSDWPPQFELMKLEAQAPNGEWIPIFPAQLRWMAKDGAPVRAIEHPSAAQAEPVMWVCLVPGPAPAGAEMRIRAWTADRKRMENLRAEGLDMQALYTASPPAALPAGAWQPADSTPPVSAGQMKEFIVAVYRPKTGKVYTFGCMYLNEHRIQYEYCPKKDDPGFCDDCEDGCKTTGWFYLVGDDNNESGCYQPIWLSEGAKLIGWQDLPQWDGALPSTPSKTGAD